MQVSTSDNLDIGVAVPQNSHVSPFVRMNTALLRTFRRHLHSAVRLRDQQAQPLKVLLDNPFQPANPLPPGVPRPTASIPPAKPLPPSQPSTQSREDSRVEKARVVFGSRLAGPGRRVDNVQKGTIVAGVRIPPKPLEPDNCCMSGCVNCTWDIFREDLEEWRSARAEAHNKLKLQKTAEFSNLSDDGPLTGGMWEGFEGIPVGMRAFMETEKRLKEKHKSQESTSG